MIINHVLNHDMTIYKAKVVSNNILGKGTAIPGRIQTIKKITIHNTGNDNVKALNYHKALNVQNNLKNGRQASWHLCVDDVQIHQHVKFNWEAWHAGNSTGNKTSIGIECTQWTDKAKQEATWLNAAALTAMLLKHYNLTVNDVVQHNHWSGKDCPYYLRHSKHGFDWNWFISKVKGFYNGELVSTVKPNTNENTSISVDYLVQVTADELNVRTGPSTSYDISTVIKKDEVYTIREEQKGWGRLKSGAGWINLSYTKVHASFIAPPSYMVEITADTLNIRKDAGTSYATVGTVKKGQVYTIVQEKNGWGKLKSGAGWISLSYTKKI